MKIGLITDIHANLEALEAVLRALSSARVDRIVCLGDVVGYGADPEACCNLVRERAALTLVGNHDAAVAGRHDRNYYHGAAWQVILSHRERLSPENLAWLKRLQFEEIDREASAAYCHASPLDPETYGYMMIPYAASLCAETRADLRGLRAVFFGHSHLPFCFEVDPETPDFDARKVDGPIVRLRADRQYYVSVPSVGQPRDYDTRAGCGVYDAGAATFEFIRIEYNYELAAQKIEEAGYAPEFASRLHRGV